MNNNDSKYFIEKYLKSDEYKNDYNNLILEKASTIFSKIVLLSDNYLKFNNKINEDSQKKSSFEEHEVIF